MIITAVCSCVCGRGMITGTVVVVVVVVPVIGMLSGRHRHNPHTLRLFLSSSRQADVQSATMPATPANISATYVTLIE